MATELESLEARKTVLLADIAALTSSPSYNIDGQAVDHAAHRRSLYEELATINRAISVASGPFEIDTRGY